MLFFNLHWNKYTFLILGLFFASFRFGFTQQTLESQRARLKDTLHDTARVNILNWMSWELQYDSADQAYAYAEKALELAKDTYKYGQAEAYKCMASVHDNLGEYEEALAKYDTATTIFAAIGERQAAAYVYYLIGAVKINQGDYNKALEYLFFHLSAVEEYNDTARIAAAYVNIGLAYGLRGDSTKELEYYKKVLEIEKWNGDYAATALNNMGITYLEQQKYDSAYRYLNEAYEMPNRDKSIFTEAILLRNLGSVNMHLGYLLKASSYIYQALEMQEKSGDQKNLVLTLIELGKLNEKLGKIDLAILETQKAYTIARKIGDKFGIRNSSQYLHSLYAKKGDYRQAYSFHQQYKAYDDSISNEDKAREIGRLETKYEYDQRDVQRKLENRLKEVNREKKALRQKRIRDLLALALLLISIIAVLGYWSYKRKKSDNELLRQQGARLVIANEEITAINENLESIVQERTQSLLKSNYDLKRINNELDTFLYHSSHDFRGPITTLLGLDKLASITLHEAKAKELFIQVGNTAFSMEKMLRKLLMVTNINRLSDTPQMVDLPGVLEKVRKELVNFTGIKEVNIRTNFQVNQMLSHHACIHAILYNLLENALLFNDKPECDITVEAQTIHDKVKLTVLDNGEGIPEIFMDKVFTMFFRANEKSKGNGLGLYVVSKAVDKLGGTINLESTEKEGTKVIIEIPVISADATTPQA